MELATFLTTLANYLSIYWPEQLQSSIEPEHSVTKVSNRDLLYDFIIVGAGSAGCVVANRLSENPEWKVLLIEAGGNNDFVTDTPALSLLLPNSKYVWNFTTTEQEFCCLDNSGHCAAYSGHVMGGTSSLNGMYYVRGVAEDYNEWARMGNQGWSYKDVLPYFLKAENMTIDELQRSPYHSTNGPLSVSYPVYKLPVNEDFIRAGKEYGLEEVDYNGETQLGIGKVQFTMAGASRCSTSKAYLDPIKNRENLYIFQDTLVDKVLIDQDTKRALGVRCRTNNEIYNVYGSKEVILSAGTVNTAKLLILSGAGPQKDLEELGIEVKADLPVGKTLVDHAGVLWTFSVNNNVLNCCDQISNDTIFEYAAHKDGLLTAYQWQILAFIKHNQSVLSLFMGVDKLLNFCSEDKSNLQVLILLMNPNSSGKLTLNSSSYDDDPLINPRYLTEEPDMKSLVWATRELLTLMHTSAMSRYEWKLNIVDTPQCKRFYTEEITDEFLECYLSYQGNTGSFHNIGTARMGPTSDKLSVVDPKLKVHSIDRLRVIDASVMPRIPRGNTNAPTIMIAEKGSDLIKSLYSG